MANVSISGENYPYWYNAVEWYSWSRAPYRWITRRVINQQLKRLISGSITYKYPNEITRKREQYAQLRDPLTVYDFGAGDIHTFQHRANMIIKNGGTYVAIDNLSHDFIKQQKKTLSGKNLPVHYCSADINSLDESEFPSETADVVILSSVHPGLDDSTIHDRYHLVFQQAYRILKPGGILLMSHHDNGLGMTTFMELSLALQKCSFDEAEILSLSNGLSQLANYTVLAAKK
jgi:SAM-dependent methyltransferase